MKTSKANVGGLKTLGLREIRAGYQVLQETLAKEGEVLLTHHGKPFARVLPLESTQAPLLRKPISMKWLHDQMTPLTEGSEALIREDRDAR